MPSIIGMLYTGAALGCLLGPLVAGAVFDRRQLHARHLEWRGADGRATAASAGLIASREPAY